ncbi:MAG: elongation factor P [Verrucomicrobiales bacterium]|jgi:elongation factor P|nr:elongation factor P [Verrucomicrobiales bacterium]
MIAKDLKKGVAVKWKGDVCIVMETTHRTPGNLRAFVQATLRSLSNGRSFDERFASTADVETVNVSHEKWDYSYQDQNGYNFMEPNTYDNLTLNDQIIGEAKNYLTENQQVTVVFVEGKAVAIELPPVVELTITTSAEGVRGDSANNVQKPATLETGLTVQVPLFIKEGEKIRVDTRDGKYLSRA